MLDLSRPDNLGSLGSLEAGGESSKSSLSQPNIVGDEKSNSSSSWFSMPIFTVDFYKDYFNVSSDDIIHRLHLTINPMKSFSASDESIFKTAPDFYGPFWIATTVILFMAGSANVTRFLSGQAKSADFELVSLAATYVYGCLFLIPLAIRTIVKGIPGCFDGAGAGDHVSYSQLLCVYGYSLLWLVPVTLVSISNMYLLQWVMTLAGLVLSIMFLASNLYKDFAGSLPRSRFAIIGVVCLAQILLFLLYKLYFVS